MEFCFFMWNCVDFQTLELWNTNKNKTMTLHAHDKLVSALAVSNVTGLVASASHDKCVKIWKWLNHFFVPTKVIYSEILNRFSLDAFTVVYISLRVCIARKYLDPNPSPSKLTEGSHLLHQSWLCKSGWKCWIQFLFRLIWGRCVNAVYRIVSFCFWEFSNIISCHISFYVFMSVDSQQLSLVLNL